MFPEELKILDIYTPEKEAEILEILKDYFVVTSPRFNYPIPKIAFCSIAKHDHISSFGNSDSLYCSYFIELKCNHWNHQDSLYITHKSFCTDDESKVDSILMKNIKLNNGFSFPYLPGLYAPSEGEKPVKKVATERKKPELNLDQSLQNYLIAEDLLKKMFLRNPQKTLRVLRKIYYPIMIDAKMLELADSAEELKTLKSAFGKVQNKKYRPDLRTEIFTKMRAVSEETGASYDKLKTLNATKGGLSKAAKGKFAEK
jgi:hypothetical protein